MTLIDYGLVLLYFGCVIGMGFWYRRRASKNLEAYFLGGKHLPWPALAMSGAVATFDITGTMWMVSVLFLLGMQSWWHHWMWGVMLPAFGLAFMAKWVRRSRVITAAEWMVTRFGGERDGKVARYAYALMAIITLASFIGYAFQGIGKFAAVYVPLEDLASQAPFLGELFTTYKPHVLAMLVMAVATLYVVLGGLYSVVFTDVIQTIILAFAALAIAFIAYSQLTPDVIAGHVPADFTQVAPSWHRPEFAGDEKNWMYEMFGFMVIAWIAKGFLMNAGGPAQMYDFQRYLAARNARDAAKLAAAWPLFLVPRWAMVAGITLLAMCGFADVADSEEVMPLVLQEYLPMGVRGLVIAGLLAAFMSTFAGTVNSAASYVVRDFWQPLLAPRATPRQLVRASQIATVAVVLLGIAVGFQAESISEIWNWMMMALSAGVILPNVLRWYWWRFNGWGYAAGTAGGILLSAVPLFVEKTPDYISFLLICAGSLALSLSVTLLTPPTDRRVLVGFYRTIHPFGLWGPVRREALAGGGETPGMAAARGESAGLALLNTAVAIAGITALYLGPMYLVGHWHGNAAICLGIVVAAVIALYFTWYRNLPPAEEADSAPV
jgi:Na+/proline symporter